MPSHALKREDFESLVAGGAVIVDVRPVDEFVKEHFAGSIFISPNRRRLPSVLRACVTPPSPIVLVAGDESVAEAAQKLVAETGEYRVAGTVSVEMGWASSLRYPTESLAVMSVGELVGRIAAPARDFRLVDVREPFEWKLGYIDGSALVSLKEVKASSEHWDRKEEIVCICEEGLRSTSAASLLKRHGFRAATTVKSGIAEWFSSKLPLREP